MEVLRSRSNPRVRRWQYLLYDARARRKEARALIEGPHLVSAYLAAGGVPQALIVAEGAVGKREVSEIVDGAGVELVVVSDRAFRQIADAETPQGIAAEIAIPAGRVALADSPARKCRSKITCPPDPVSVT